LTEKHINPVSIVVFYLQWVIEPLIYILKKILSILEKNYFKLKLYDLLIHQSHELALQLRVDLIGPIAITL